MVSRRSPLAVLKAIRRLRTWSPRSSSCRTRSLVVLREAEGVDTTTELAGMADTGVMAGMVEVSVEAMVEAMVEVVQVLLSRGNWTKPALYSI